MSLKGFQLENIFFLSQVVIFFQFLKKRVYQDLIVVEVVFGLNNVK